MKFLIIGLTKIKYMPYLNFYINNIDTSNEIHVCYWNRDSKEEDLSKYKNTIFHEYKYYQTNGASLFKKIPVYLKYRKFVKRINKDVKPNFIIILHTPAGLISKSILKTNKFIYDYRDSTYEKHKFFRKKVNSLVKDSLYTFVSSDAFRKFFFSRYENKIYTSHNLLEDSLNHRNDREIGFISSDKIRITFWGFIRNKEVNIELINKISEDERFELHYYGREQETAIALKEYVNQNAISNVFFHGEYKPEDRYNFIKQTDIIHNIYNDANMMLAMGNKYYDGIIFKIPLLSFKKSFMGERSVNAGIGFECNPFDDNFTDKLFLDYSKLNREVFVDNCNNELERVLKEYYKGTELIKRIK